MKGAKLFLAAVLSDLYKKGAQTHMKGCRFALLVPATRVMNGHTANAAKENKHDQRNRERSAGD